MGKEKFMNDHNTALHLKREERLKDLLEIIINSPNGMSAKEMGAALKTSADSARLYIKDLLARNLIAVSHQEGKTRIYKAVDPATVKPIEEQPVAEEAPKEDLMPVGHSGKEFEPGSYIPCGDSCRPGDVVWVSSRSGEGAFFRYLVITPWEYKAMVLGIFEEGHPKLNVNDPYYVYIGDDPEKGVRLYADLRNTCQRGYRQFGEKVMHVNQDLFDDVKGRLARSMGISCKKIDPDVVRLLKEQLDKAKAAVAAVSKDRDDKYKAWADCDKANNELKTEVADMANTITDLNNQLLQAGHKLESCNLQIQSLEEHHASAAKEIKGLQERNNNQAETITELNNQLIDLQKELETKEAVAIKPKYDDDIVLGMVIDSKVKETKIEMLEEQVKMLRQMVFNMIKGGGAA